MSTRRTFIKQIYATAALNGGVALSATPNVADHSLPSAREGIRETYKLPQTDLVVSRIGYACANLVAWDRAPITAADISTATRFIHTACDYGITLFDHADLYAFGKAEAVFGEVLKQSPGLRDSLIIQSKCGQRLPEGWNPGDPIHADLSREHIVSSAERTLQRLATDRLDILLLHVADTLAQPEEIAQAFEQLHRSGKVRYFGVTNYNAAQIQLLKKSVRQPIVVNQFQLGLAHPYPLIDGMELTLQLTKGVEGTLNYRCWSGDGIFDYCRLSDITVFGALSLSGISKSLETAKPERSYQDQLLMDIAAMKGITPLTVALAWLLQHPAKVVPIINHSEVEAMLGIVKHDRAMLSRTEWYDLFSAETPLQLLLE